MKVPFRILRERQNIMGKSPEIPSFFLITWHESNILTIFVFEPKDVMKVTSFMYPFSHEVKTIYHQILFLPNEIQLLEP